MLLYNALINGRGNENPSGGNENPSGGNENPSGGNEATVVCFPVEGGVVTVGHDEFFYNLTSNSYYPHTGVDVAAEVGAKVYACVSGKIVSIFYHDVLLGTVVQIETENEELIEYRYVDCVDGLAEGEEVTVGQHIAFVAEPVGAEYKEGPHLHIQAMDKRGQYIDPSVFWEESTNE